MKLKAALLVDNLKVCEWQKNALDAASEYIDITLILNCENTKSKKNYKSHFMYYALNLLALRNRLTKRKLIENSSARVLNFKSKYEGQWQYLPEKIIDQLREEKVDLIIKFGMGLLRVDEQKRLPPILSYHHGNPSKYRGRPAGFYEILHQEKTVGIIIQSIGNKLDAGDIYAYAESKVVDYSYKKTALNFYENSAPLLNAAIRNIFNENKIKFDVEGKNYRLPSNLLVAKFIFNTFEKLIRRILYGLFFEKQWRIATFQGKVPLEENYKLPSYLFKEIRMLGGYNFYADPFYSEDGNRIRFEALDSQTGLGDILEAGGPSFSEQRVLLTGQHFSYPCSFSYCGKEYLLPEVASHSDQYFLEIGDFNKKYYLKGLENKRIIDATPYQKDHKLYLFFGVEGTANTMLHLWVSDSPFCEFKPHPMSPIVVSPSVSRMGGKIINYQGKIFRFGQDNSNNYGNALSVMQVTSLSEKVYQECKVGDIRIDKFSGPHSITFNTDMSEVIIDYYSTKFSMLAGVRRIKAAFSNKFNLRKRVHTSHKIV